MTESIQTPAEFSPAKFLMAGQDWFGEQRGLRMSQINFKVVPQDNSSGVLILENTFQARGGPARHLHFDQDEWFYVVEGEFIFEVGQEAFRLAPGDALLAPRKVPHVWAHVGSQQGKILISFLPAGQMEAFFRKYMTGNVPPPTDPEAWRAHGMELLGPPLAIG
jgi:quercetin dioxygenase-like cupin family protein